jgi:hypothetical protein
MYVGCYPPFDTVRGGGEYDLRIEVEHLPVESEDSADLSVGTACVPRGERWPWPGGRVFCTTGSTIRASGSRDRSG